MRSFSGSGVRSRLDSAWGWLLAGVLATIVTWPVVFHAGLPAFFHDWTWPLFHDQLIATWQSLISAWNDAALGRPNSVPTMNPLAWLKIGLGLVAPADAAAKLYLWLSVAAACAGIVRLAFRTLSLGPVWAAFAAVAFAVSPLLFAKIASGQSSEWAAIGAFVWGYSFMADAFARRSISLGACAALLFALATNQLQYLVFAEIAALLGLAAHRDKEGARVWLVVALGSCVFALPALWFLGARGPLAGAEVSPPYGLWERSQSSSVGDAFALLGYAAGYPEQYLRTLGPYAVTAVRWAMWIVGLLAAAGAVASRSRVAYMTAVLGIIGFLSVSGVRGPAQGLWLWTFDHASFAAFLREFYHAATLLGIAYAACSALALSRLAQRSRVAAAFIAVAVLAVSGLATWGGGLREVLPFVQAPAYETYVQERIPSAPGTILFLPPERPLYVAGDSIGGDDAFDWVDPELHSLFDYYPPGPLAYAVAELNAGHRTALDDLARLDCVGVVWRSDVRSPLWSASAQTLREALGDRASVDGAIVDAPLLIDGPSVVDGAEAARPLPPSLTAMSDASAVYLDRPGVDSAASLPAGLWAPDPASGWVGYRDVYWRFDRGLATPTLGVVTTKRDAVFDVPGGDGALLLWAPDGALVDGRKVSAPDYVRVRRTAAPMRIVALGTTAIGELGERPVEVAVKPSIARASRVSPWLYQGTIDLDAKGVVELRRSYDPGWTLHVDGATVDDHVRADGYANAWIVSGTGAHAMTIEYAPQRATFVLLSASVAAALALAALGIFMRGRQSPNGT